MTLSLSLFIRRINIIVMIMYVTMMAQSMACGLKVNENICVVSTLQWKRSTVQNGMTFIQHHITWCHRYVVSLTIMPNYLNRPILIYILRHIDNRGTYKRQSIHMRCKDCTFLINPNTIQGTWCKLFSGPFLQCAFGCIP